MVASTPVWDYDENDLVVYLTDTVRAVLSHDIFAEPWAYEVGLIIDVESPTDPQWINCTEVDYIQGATKARDVFPTCDVPDMAKAAFDHTETYDDNARAIIKHFKRAGWVAGRVTAVSVATRADVVIAVPADYAASGDNPIAGFDTDYQDWFMGDAFVISWQTYNADYDKWDNYTDKDCYQDHISGVVGVDYAVQVAQDECPLDIEDVAA